MSSWDVYWILMLDNIKDGISGPIGAVLTFVVLCGGFELAFWSVKFDEIRPRLRALCLFVLYPAACIALFVSILLYVFLPSTKQAAVIYIAPRVLTDENIDAASAETREVYGLFKSWLREQAGVEAESAE